MSSRIRANPAAFAQLPPDQQALVQSGRIEVGSGADAVSLALGDPHYVTYEANAVDETQVVHDYGDFMIPAANLPHKVDVWHYQDRSLKGYVDGDEQKIVYDRNARVAVIERNEPLDFKFGTSAPAPVFPTPDQQMLAASRHVAIGFDSALVRFALGKPDRVTLRTEAAGSTLIWHYKSAQLNRAPDRTTIQDRLAVTFAADGRVTAVEEEKPLDFNLRSGGASSGGLTSQQRAVSLRGQVAVGFDPVSARRVVGVPDRVTLRTSAAGRTVL